MKSASLLRQPDLIRNLLHRTAAPPPTPLKWRTFFTSTRPVFCKTKASQSLAFRAGRLPSKSWPLMTRKFRSVRFNSSQTPPKPNPTPHLGSLEPSPSITQRLRKLSREYGWSALGVYMALSALDFPFCFLAVRMLGTERIGRYEHVVIEAFWKVVRVPFPNLGRHDRAQEAHIGEGVGEATARDGQLGWSGEVEKADAKNKGSEASM